MRYLALYMGSFNAGAAIDVLSAGVFNTMVIIKISLAILLIAYFTYEELKSRKMLNIQTVVSHS